MDSSMLLINDVGITSLGPRRPAPVAGPKPSPRPIKRASPSCNLVADVAAPYSGIVSHGPRSPPVGTGRPNPPRPINNSMREPDVASCAKGGKPVASGSQPKGNPKRYAMVSTDKPNSLLGPLYPQVTGLIDPGTSGTNFVHHASRASIVVDTGPARFDCQLISS